MMKKITKYDLNKCIFHSDHGSVYFSHEYIELIAKHNAEISMGRVGKSADNLIIEAT
jgi:transposase InsO family protein